MPHRRRLFGFDTLEARDVPTGFGVPWADPGHLTLSFPADGTATPRGADRLGQTMAAAGSNWQREVLRAFQSWAAVANINIGVVNDGGQPLGTTGAVQGDYRFGDVRVAAAPLTDDVLASASPFSWTGTTYAGDLFFNSTEPFRVGSSASAYDIYSVAVHEAGHSLGLDHSTVAGSVMNEGYAYRTGLSAADVAAIRALYGARTPDANEGAVGNDTPARATAMQATGLFGRVVADGDLTTVADVDDFKFSTLPTLGLTSVTVRFQADGLSLVTPRITVYNAAGQVVAQGASSDPLNNDVTLKFPNATFGGTYTVKVEGLTDDVFGIGSYHLTVDTINLTTPIPLLNALLAPVADGHLNDTLSAATDLTAAPKGDARFDATYRGVIEDRTDTDDYKIKAPPGTAPVDLNVMVWGTDAAPLAPRVRVFDAGGNPVAYRLLANEGGLYSVEVDNVTAGATYYVQVAARNPSGSAATGGYFLGADFNQGHRTNYDGLGSGTVRSTAGATGNLVVTDPGVFAFALAATGGATGDGVTMQVLDASGRVVRTIDAISNQAAGTTTLYLAAGTYTVRYVYRGTSTSTVQYDLFFLRLSEDVGPYATKTGSKPDSGSPSPNGGYTYDSASSAPPPGEYYYF